MGKLTLKKILKDSKEDPTEDPLNKLLRKYSVYGIWGESDNLLDNKEGLFALYKKSLDPKNAPRIDEIIKRIMEQYDPAHPDSVALAKIEALISRMLQVAIRAEKQNFLNSDVPIFLDKLLQAYILTVMPEAITDLATEIRIGYDLIVEEAYEQFNETEPLAESMVATQAAGTGLGAGATQAKPSLFLRDSDGNILDDSEGFPLINPTVNQGEINKAISQVHQPIPTAFQKQRAGLQANQGLQRLLQLIFSEVNRFCAVYSPGSKKKAAYYSREREESREIKSELAKRFMMKVILPLIEKQMEADFEADLERASNDEERLKIRKKESVRRLIHGISKTALCDGGPGFAPLSMAAAAQVNDQRPVTSCFWYMVELGQERALSYENTAFDFTVAPCSEAIASKLRGGAAGAEQSNLSTYGVVFEHVGHYLTRLSAVDTQKDGYMHVRQLAEVKRVEQLQKKLEKRRSRELAAEEEGRLTPDSPVSPVDDRGASCSSYRRVFQKAYNMACRSHGVADLSGGEYINMLRFALTPAAMRGA